MTKATSSYILWLPSWYPNKLAPFDGDFVQRHARAAALYNDILVIYAVADEERMSTNDFDQSLNKDGRLTEHIIYFKKSAGFLGRVQAFLKWNKLLKKSIKRFIEENGKPRLVHVHVSMKAGLIARWIKRRYGISYVVSEHSTHYKMGSHDDFFDKSFVYRRAVAGIFRQARAVTNVSVAMGNVIKELFNLRKVYTINNTVDTSLFNNERSDNKKFTFIHVSTLTESQKNVAGMLRVVGNLSKRRQDFELRIVGPATKEVEELIKSSGIENLVTLTGEIPYANVSKQMKMSSSLVLFSRYENLPCVIIEALCCGLPVISTDVGGVKELVNETNGKLVHSENERELEESMNDIMNEYENYNREQISASARERFSYPTIGKQFDELYIEVSG
ncbi:MAG TPA: glycosyltransferase [Chitinophagaceae bacterium]|jgi:glycosyltransferase involved in cell wall biosynthesis|nr:glycosyltransferase [Chitinophagaceae bacterium]